MKNSPRDLNDEDLVVYVRTKNNQSYEEVVKRYQQKLFRYARSLLGDEDDSLDAVQDSFIKAYVNINSFDPKQKFSSWIYRIVHNESLNFLQKRKRLTFLSEEEWQEIAEKDSDFAESLHKKIVSKQLMQILDEMEPKYKEPLLLFFMEGFTYQEISNILHLPVQTVGTRINRGKKQLNALCLKKGLNNL